MRRWLHNVREKLPKTWAYARLDQVATVVAGNPAPQGSEYFDGGEYNFVRVHDMGENGNCTFLRKTRDLVNDKAATKLRLFPSGSILFTKSGASTLLNQRAILAKDSYVVSHIAAAVPFSGVENEWIFHFLKLVDFAKLAHATNMPSLPLSRAKAIEIPVAPAEEQHRIVAKIEKLFFELDKGIESLKTACEQLKVYRQAVLKHAFEGKLTAQWREENKDKLEKPEQLLARIKQEREARYERQLQEWTGAVKTWEAKGKLGKKPTKPKKLKALSSDEVPTLPEGWSWFSLSAIAGNIQIGPFGSLLHKADYLVGGTPLVNPSHIRFQRIEPDRTLTVSAGKLHQLGKYVMHENDIVIGRRGEMGRCAVVTAAEAGWLCGTGSLFVRLLSSMNPHFYSWVLGSQRVKDFLAASSIGTTMQNLNEGILHRVPVPVCSRHEQDEVFREIERQYSTLDHIEAIIDSEITKSATLRQSILKRAFAGQLVAQDPSDEPASVLLDRIKANKEQISKKAAATKKTREKRTPA